MGAVSRVALLLVMAAHPNPMQPAPLGWPLPPEGFRPLAFPISGDSVCPRLGHGCLWASSTQNVGDSIRPNESHLLEGED